MIELNASAKSTVKSNPRREGKGAEAGRTSKRFKATLRLLESYSHKHIGGKAVNLLEHIVPERNGRGRGAITRVSRDYKRIQLVVSSALSGLYDLSIVLVLFSYFLGDWFKLCQLVQPGLSHSVFARRFSM